MSHKHDVNTYMAIRWYVNTIENLAISTYAGYPGRKDDIMSYLKCAAKSLELLSRGPATPPLAGGSREATRAPEATGSGNREAASEGGNYQTLAMRGGGIEPDNDCPWQTCKDGACRPSCTISPK